ncbi:amino-acid permease bat1 [Quercus suber]|uniref:Amino-acid permease bat1 n=1 Tax=Quercus suber TaxID=58331 RepID=A0AAW0MCU8_QUESU
MVCLKPSISQNSYIFSSLFRNSQVFKSYMLLYSLKHISYLYTVFKTLAITFSCTAVFPGTPLYGPSLLYAGPPSLIWGWVVVSFFTWFAGLALAEICFSFPTAGSLHFWATHLARPRWGPFASWYCARLETIGIISGIAAQAYSGAQALQMIILLSTGTNKGGGYFAKCIFMHWHIQQNRLLMCSHILRHPLRRLEYIANFMQLYYDRYSLSGYDTVAHLIVKTRGADRTGPIAILSSIGIVTIFGWAYYLALTFSIHDLNYLYDVNNETASVLVIAQRERESLIAYALSRDRGIPFSPRWRRVHPKHKVPTNAVTIGWVGGYAIPIFAKLVIAKKNFEPGPFYLGKARRPICLVAFLWICYTCSTFLLPTAYPLQWKTFNYVPIALAVALTLIMLWWFLDARKLFKGPTSNAKRKRQRGREENSRSYYGMAVSSSLKI